MGIALPLIDGVLGLLDKIIPDKDAREKAKVLLMQKEMEADLEALKLSVQSDVEQMRVNAEEAKHANVFVAGWRPFIGWVCGIAMAYHFILQPLLAFIIANNSELGDVKLPSFDMDALFTVLMGMLGLGGMRTFEKIKGVARQGAPKKDKT